MEHEIIGHSKKALKILKDHKKPFWEKSKEILTEILIIVFAVTFAALIERTREHYKEKAEAKEFLVGVKEDLKDETRKIERVRNEMINMRDAYSKILKLNQKAVDSLNKSNTKQSFFVPRFDTRASNGRYEGFKSSGKIQTIGDDSIRNNLLKLYQESIPLIDFTENIFNANQVRLEDFVISNADSQGEKETDVMRMLASSKGKLILSFSLDYSNAVVNAYDRALKQAKKVDAEISAQYEE